ncbi:MAG: proprotein convertase P-domain-containing protein [Saprospiraceae bacterium]|nr:proprotein convertase P-domain-containing protein [Saprospiraceae bacterium]
MRQTISSFFILLSLASLLQAQSLGNLWQLLDRQTALNATAQSWVTPSQGQFYQLDYASLTGQLQAGNTVNIQLPLPDGSFSMFSVKWSPCAALDYYATHPGTGTYSIHDVRNPAIQGRIDHTVNGFHAIIFQGNRTIMIDPVHRGRTDIYAVYFKDEYWSDNDAPISFTCQMHEELSGDINNEFVGEIVSSLNNVEPVDIIKYRLVIATTGEYAQFHGGSKPLVAAELITAVNRINAVLIKDMGIQIELIAQNDKVIFLDPITDGYSNGDTELMIDQNPVRIGLQIPLDNYDIGHVFGLATNGQVGLAQLGSVCTNSKARGVSGLFTPKFDPFYVGVICHEMGHQFSATHSFNKCSNENPGTGWEPGGGSTIMSYSGACGSNSVKNNADDYYHGGSLGQMKNFIRTGSGAQCGQKIPTSNFQPSVNFTYKNGFYIPISTPFKLTASGSDEDGTPLAFCWEGMDTGPITDAGDPVQTSPLFRSFPPVTDSVRVFPRMSLIVQKQNSKFEVLPDYSREMSFRVTVRDNNLETGSIAQKDLLFHATEFAGPFTVTSFSNIDTVRQGEYVEITWDVAGTDASPVNCKIVNIRLSLDGGTTYPILLAEAVPNNGSFWVTMPKVQSSLCRIMVEAADNIFFNISGANLRLLPPLEAGYTLQVSPYLQTGCLPETVQLRIKTESLLGFNEPVSLSIVSGLPPGATAYFDQATLLPPAEATLYIETAEVTKGGTYLIQIQAQSSSGVSLFRPAELILVRNDFSSLQATAPVSGSSAVGSSPLLKWVSQEDAASYRVELASSPAFGSTVILQSGVLTDTFFQILATLDANTLYFWRVLPENVCGIPNEIPVFAFHTASISCTDFVNDVEQVIPGQGIQTIHSVITVPSDGTVTEIRIPKIAGNHQNIGQLRGTLKSPTGKTSRLFLGKCFFITGTIDMGFNDESLVPFACPPDNAQIYKSEDPLSNLTGENIKGDWTLTIEDVATGGGGKLSNWTLSLCSDFTINNPFLVRQDTLFIAPGTTRAITNTLLLADDQESFPWELTFTLVRAPYSGQLFRDGLPVGVGTKFTQQDLYDGLITYAAFPQVEGFDSFLFTVEDGDGGWFGITSYPIKTDNSVSTGSPSANPAHMTLTPNPATDQVRLQLADQSIAIGQVLMYNNLGQAVPATITVLGPGQMNIDLSGLPAGMYVVAVHFAAGRSTQRLVLTK